MRLRRHSEQRLTWELPEGGVISFTPETSAEWIAKFIAKYRSAMLSVDTARRR